MEKVMFDGLLELDYGVTEALRTLKTNIQFCGDDIKVIVLTSSIAEEGKSTISFNLARSFAESEQKVAFIDCDIRRSVLVGRMKAHLEKRTQIFGLSHYLTGQKKLEEVLYHTEMECLDVIFSGPVVPNPTEILGNHYFEEMITRLRNDYDMVIMDAPPLGSVIDAAVIATHADGAILVIKEGTVSRRFVKDVKKQLESSGVRILGAVLNGVQMEKKSYYKKYYGKYYEKGNGVK